MFYENLDCDSEYIMVNNLIFLFIKEFITRTRLLQFRKKHKIYIICKFTKINQNR